VKGLRLSLTQAAWRVSEDLPASSRWQCGFLRPDAGHRVAHTIVHVHVAWASTRSPGASLLPAAKETEFALGGATGQLRRIGRELAETPA